MRRAVTIAVPHKGKPKVIAGPDVPYDVQLKALKQASISRAHEEYARVEIWLSDVGVTKTAKFIHPDEEARRKKAAEAEAKAIAEAKAKAEEAEAKAKAKS